MLTFWGSRREETPTAMGKIGPYKGEGGQTERLMKELEDTQWTTSNYPVVQDLALHY
jgi:hypothetical protein